MFGRSPSEYEPTTRVLDLIIGRRYNFSNERTTTLSEDAISSTIDIPFPSLKNVDLTGEKKENYQEYVMHT